MPRLSKSRVDGRPVDFHPYHGRSGWLQELDGLVTTLRRDNIPPGRISILLLKTPRPDEEKHLERMGLRRLSEDDAFSSLSASSSRNTRVSCGRGGSVT